MPDQRLTKLADLLCTYSLEVEPGHVVWIDAPAVAQPLVLELVKAVTDRGAHVVVRATLESVTSAYLAHASEKQLSTPTPLDWLEVEVPDRRLVIWTSENSRYLSGIPSEKLSLRSRAFEPLDQRVSDREVAGSVKICGTHFPTHSAAQDAGMALEDWQDFVFTAGHVSDDDPAAYWREREAQQQLVADRLSQYQELRITAAGTDLRVNVAGRPWVNAAGRENFPDGEVFTSPHHQLTEGNIAFSFRSLYSGKLVDGVELRFEKGRVVEASAAHGQEHLLSLLDSDEGARYLGEIAFGLNDEITTATSDTLFDEKIGGTCHLALGMAFAEAGGTNRSGVHWDLICDLRQAGRVYGDGELIYESGKFL